MGMAAQNGRVDVVAQTQQARCRTLRADASVEALRRFAEIAEAGEETEGSREDSFRRALVGGRDRIVGRNHDAMRVTQCACNDRPIASRRQRRQTDQRLMEGRYR